MKIPVFRGDQLKADMYIFLVLLGFTVTLSKGALENPNFAYWAAFAVGAGASGLALDLFGSHGDRVEDEKSLPHRIAIMAIGGGFLFLHSGFVILLTDYLTSNVIAFVGWE